MTITPNPSSADAVQRKLRALAAVFLDPAATEHEKATAARLEERLENQLAPQAANDRALSGIMFRLGRGLKEITSPPPQKGDWTDHAFRLGKMMRRGIKR